MVRNSGSICKEILSQILNVSIGITGISFFCAHSQYQFLSPRNSFIIRDTFLWVNDHYTEIKIMLIYKNVKLYTLWEVVAF